MNTGHIGKVAGFNDNIGQGSLYDRYPIKEFVPVAESVYARVQWVKRGGLAGSGRVRLPSESSAPRALPVLGSAYIDIQTR